MRSSPDTAPLINYKLDFFQKDLRFTPDSVITRIRIQHAKQTQVFKTYKEITAFCKEIARKEHLDIKIRVRRAFHEFIPNLTALELTYKNMLEIPPISYAEEEITFARKMQEYLRKPINKIAHRILPFDNQVRQKSSYGYVSDIGDASWHAPEIYFVSTIIPSGIPMHSWPTSAFTAHAIGHKGMLYAANVMAGTIIDYLKNPELQDEIRIEFSERIKDYSYESLLPPGVPLIYENSKSN